MITSSSEEVEPTIAVEANALFRRVFVPIDFSMASHRALGVALELQSTHGSRVCVFHWVESSGSDDWLGGIGSPSVQGDWVTETKERLRRFLENIAPGSSQNVEVHARFGETIASIRRAAKEWDATLVIAAVGVHRALLRSAAEQLVHDFDVPTLIIPADAPSESRLRTA